MEPEVVVMKALKFRKFTYLYTVKEAMPETIVNVEHERGGALLLACRN